MVCISSNHIDSAKEHEWTDSVFRNSLWSMVCYRGIPGGYSYGGDAIPVFPRPYR